MSRKRRYRTTAKYSKRQLAARKRVRSELNEVSQIVDEIENLYSDIDIKGIEELKARLSQAGLLTKSGKIRKTLPRTFRVRLDTRIVDKSINAFKKSPVGSTSSIKKTLESQRGYLSTKIGGEFVSRLSDKQIFDFYYMYEDEKFQRLSQTYGSDYVNDVILDSIKDGLSKDEMMDEMMKHLDDSSLDQDTIDDLTQIYDEYIAYING